MNAQNDAQGDALREQKDLTKQYQAGFQDYSNLSRRGENQQERGHQALSREGYANLDELSAALGGKERQAAIEGGRMDYLNRSNDVLGRVGAQDALPADTTIQGKTWGDRAAAFYNPRLAARQNLLTTQGAQVGGGNFDSEALNTLGNQQVDVGRRSAELDRRAQLMQAFRDRQLAADANRFKYQGPSSGYYNAQMFGQLAQLAGTGIQSYSANQSTTPTSQG